MHASLQTWGDQHFKQRVRLLTGRYFRRLQKRYAPDAALASALGNTAGGAASSNREDPDAMEGAEAAVPGDASLRVPVACINLLRCNMQACDRPLGRQIRIS